MDNGSNMADNKENVILNGIVLGIAAIGGTLLAARLIEQFGSKRIVYECPNCKGYVKLHENPCPHCKMKLDWDSQYASI